MARAEIKARATLDDTGFKRGIASMKQGVEGFKNNQIKQLGGMMAGAFAVTAITNFTKNTLQASNDLADMAANLGMNVEQLQALQVTAERAGSSAEAMNATLAKASKMGLDITEVAKAYMGVDGATVSLADAHKVLGKNATSLNATMQILAEQGIEGVTAKLKSQNQIMTEESVKAADALQKKYEELGTSISTFFKKAVVGIAGLIDRYIVQPVQGAAALIGALQSGSSMREAIKISRDAIAKPAEIAVKKGLAMPVKDGKDKLAATIEKLRQSFKESLENITVTAPIAADSLARIGGIIGGQSNPMLGAIERQEKIQELQKKLQEKIAEATEKAAKASERTADILEED